MPESSDGIYGYERKRQSRDKIRKLRKLRNAEEKKILVYEIMKIFYRDGRLRSKMLKIGLALSL